MKTLTFAEAHAACAAGKTVEYSKDGHLWLRQNLLAAWWPAQEIYRLAESPIAEGHNPEKLTEEVVGVADGWRLLTEEESKPSRRVPETEWWNDGCWQSLPPGDSGWWCWPNVTLRTKKPPGYFQPKAKRTVPCGPEDFPPGTVVKNVAWPTTSRWDYIIPCPNGVWFVFGRCVENYDSLMHEAWLRSLDGGKTWLPCWKELATCL